MTDLILRDTDADELRAAIVADVLAELHSHRRARHGWFLWGRSGCVMSRPYSAAAARARPLPDANGTVLLIFPGGLPNSGNLE